MKIAGELPKLSVTISDHRLQEILDLVGSIPFPEGGPPPPPEEEIDYDTPDIQNMALDINANAERMLTKITKVEDEVQHNLFFNVCGILVSFILHGQTTMQVNSYIVLIFCKVFVSSL